MMASERLFTTEGTEGTEGTENGNGLWRGRVGGIRPPRHTPKGRCRSLCPLCPLW